MKPDNAVELSNALQDARPAVVILASNLGVGGAERQTVALAHLLSDHFRVVLAYLKPNGQRGIAVDKARLADLCSLEVRSRIDMRAAKRLAALASTHNAQLILCANSYALMYAQIARAGSPRRITVVEVFHTTKLATMKERLEMIFYRPFFWAADHLVYVCGLQRQYWSRRALWARRMHVIYNGVDGAFFDPALFKDGVAARRATYGFGVQDRVVGICAVLRPEKAHRDLLRAVSLLRAEGNNWKVLIIGDGPMRSVIERETARLGLGDAVVITGLQSDVRGCISVCDLMALVSTAIETFSIAALEAMAMAKPMVMSDVGGAREQVTHAHNGFLFPAGDVQALAQCLRSCSDPATVRQMGDRARERVLREFTQQAMMSRYTELLNQALPIGARPT